ncbi:hypothetical protein ACFVQ4_11250 [Streptomyces laurentii]|uniref:hypothetical protein n=1 Tax=Streptomyces laurentii TaxID=39478 RepID=UPI0036A31AD4
MLPLVSGCGASQEEVLKAFALELPDCEITDQTFSGTTGWLTSDLTMSFTASDDCVDRYLKDHDVDLADALNWPYPGTGTIGGKPVSPTDPPFRQDAMKKFDLKLNPKRTYPTYNSFRTPVNALFDVVLVSHDNGTTTVYMDVRDVGSVDGASGH